MATTAATMTVAEADTLYEQYGRPLEPDHNGEYLAITRTGQTILGTSVLDVLTKKDEALGAETYTVLFKVGGPSVYKWR